MGNDRNSVDMNLKFWKNRPKWMPNWLSIPLIMVGAYVVFSLFYGENSYVKSSELGKRVDELRMEIKNYQDSTLYYERKLKELHTGGEEFERIAREKYGMKKVDEDVFILEPKK